MNVYLVVRKLKHHVISSLIDQGRLYVRTEWWSVLRCTPKSGREGKRAAALFLVTPVYVGLDWFYDSFPPKNQRLSLTNVSWLLDPHEEGCYYENVLWCFLVCKERAIERCTSGWQGRGTVFEEIRPGAGFKTGDFVKEKLGGLQ